MDKIMKQTALLMALMFILAIFAGCSNGVDAPSDGPSQSAEQNPSAPQPAGADNSGPQDSAGTALPLTKETVNFTAWMADAPHIYT